MADINKVLIVAYYDSSRDAAYEISTALKEYGYGIDIAQKRREDDEEFESKIQPDVYLNPEMDMAVYRGIVFVDDGGDTKNAIKIAKNADDIDMAIGGYRHGCEVLYAADILDKKFVPANMPEAWEHGTKPINAPSVRSDNIVTCVSKCPVGFALLLIDALGGEIHKVVEGTSEEAEPIPRSALVISPITKWAEYWELSEKLAADNATMLLADYKDIDIENKVLRRCLAIGPQIRSGVAKLVRPISIPETIWFQQYDEPTSALMPLEFIGCKNVNSYEAIKAASDKTILAKVLDGAIVFDDASMEKAAEKLVSDGVRLAKSSDLRPILITGRGQDALVSKRYGGDVKHHIMSKAELTRSLRKSFNRDSFLVQEQVGNMPIGDANFELQYIMRRKEDDWTVSACLGRSGNFYCPGRQVLHSYFGDSGESKYAAGAERARGVCAAFRALLSGLDQVNELGIDISFRNGHPIAMDMTATPNLQAIAAAAQAKDAFIKKAQSVGADTQTYHDIAPSEISKARSDMAKFLRPDKQSQAEIEKKQKIERELAHQGMWVQPDGRVAMSEDDGVRVRPPADVIRIINSDLKYFLQKFNEADRINDQEAKKYSRLVRKCVLRMNLLRDLYSMLLRTSNTKTAGYVSDRDGEYDYGDGTVPGPWSNVRVPQRVLRWQEGDDWLHDIPGMDEQTISNLSRYNPDTKDGFYAEFDLWHRNDPISWEDTEKGESNYPMREQLKH